MFRRLAYTFGALLLQSAAVYSQQMQLGPLAQGLATDIAAAGKKSIAVVDFTDLHGNPTELGRFLAEEFAVALTRTHKGFEVIDRAHLKTILNEHKLTSTGLIDPATAKKLGQIVGADVLLTGSLTPFSESVRVTIKALAVDTARIIAADTTDLPKTATINELLRGGGPRQDVNNDRPPSAMHSEDVPAPIQPRETPAPMQPTSPVVVADEFQFQLAQCRGIGNSVRCSFLITNRGQQDRSLSWQCSKTLNKTARAFDDVGNESPAESCSLAGRGVEGPFDTVGALLISGVQVPCSIVYNNVAASAKSLSMINIQANWGIRGGGGGRIDVTFRSVPIQR